MVAGAGELAGSARLVLVDGAILLRPEAAVFEAILAGWRLQQESRLLAAPTVDSRDKTLRRFQEFTGEFPWRWGPADIEEWSVSLRSAGPVARHRRVDRGGRCPRVADLLLDEQRVDAVFDEMADIGMAQTVRRQLDRQTHGVAIRAEPFVDVAGADAAAPLGSDELGNPEKLQVHPGAQLQNS